MERMERWAIVHLDRGNLAFSFMDWVIDCVEHIAGDWHSTINWIDRGVIRDFSEEEKEDLYAHDLEYNQARLIHKAFFDGNKIGLTDSQE